MTPEHLLQDYFSKLSLEDLRTMKATLRKYSQSAAGMAELGESQVALAAR